MPEHDSHRAIDRLLFGKIFDKMHSAKDRPARVLGPSHRRYFHDLPSNIVIAAAEYPDDMVRAILAATVHDQVDKASTRLRRDLGRRGLRLPRRG